MRSLSIAVRFDEVVNACGASPQPSNKFQHGIRWSIKCARHGRLKSVAFQILNVSIVQITAMQSLHNEMRTHYRADFEDSNRARCATWFDESPAKGVALVRRDLED